ncbi:MAG: CDP-diacylglycerol--serine O-phosphatidyltransferase [Xanthomonadales bacterium]|nr:CDP-diacylglycerol--serine O-phosphatidyltransferase [Xanthomonadales bacterium]
MGKGGKIRQSGVFLLPNALTTGALFAGFFSIISGINGNFIAAAVAVVVAGFLDGLDGRVARLTNTQSEFGVQYDSLCDLVSFGLAPALLAFNWSLKSLSEFGPVAGKLGWLAAFVYMACAALRLARFNTQADHDDKTWFQGLASPAAAGTLVTTIWFCEDQGFAGDSMQWLVLPLTILLGLLMFSRVRYFSFKAWPRNERVPSAWIFIFALLLVLLAIDPPTVFMTVGFIYVGSGLFITITGRRSWRLRRQQRPGHSLPASSAAAEQSAKPEDGDPP